MEQAMATGRQKEMTVKSGDGASNSSASMLVMATPSMALSTRMGGASVEPNLESAIHDRLIEFVRALAREAARVDHAASRKLAEGEWG